MGKGRDKKRHVSEVLRRLGRSRPSSNPVTNGSDGFNRAAAREVNEKAYKVVDLDAGTRFSGESVLAVMACNAWLQMGRRRNMPDLAKRFQAHQLDGLKVPTTSTHTLWAWSYRFDWASRAFIYDSRSTETPSELAREEITTGLAVPHERVKALKRLAYYLEQFVYDYDALWQEIHRTVGWAKTSKIVRERIFNDKLLAQYRGVLDDLAKETQGRKTATELSGPGGGPLAFTLKDVDDIRKKVADRISALAGSETTKSRFKAGKGSSSKSNSK